MCLLVFLQSVAFDLFRSEAGLEVLELFFEFLALLELFFYYIELLL